MQVPYFIESEGGTVCVGTLLTNYTHDPKFVFPDSANPKDNAYQVPSVSCVDGPSDARGEMRSLTRLVDCDHVSGLIDAAP